MHALSINNIDERSDLSVCLPVICHVYACVKIFA